MKDLGTKGTNNYPFGCYLFSLESDIKTQIIKYSKSPYTLHHIVQVTSEQLTVFHALLSYKGCAVFIVHFVVTIVYANNILSSGKICDIGIKCTYCFDVFQNISKT